MARNKQTKAAPVKATETEEVKPPMEQIEEQEPKTQVIAAHEFTPHLEAMVVLFGERDANKFVKAASEDSSQIAAEVIPNDAKSKPDFFYPRLDSGAEGEETQYDFEHPLTVEETWKLVEPALMNIHLKESEELEDKESDEQNKYDDVEEVVHEGDVVMQGTVADIKTPEEELIPPNKDIGESPSLQNELPADAVPLQGGIVQVETVNEVPKEETVLNIPKEIEEYPLTVQIKLHELNEFAKVMDIKAKGSNENRAQQQKRLYHIILDPADRFTDEDFAIFFPILLNFFNEHKDDLFHHDYAFRGWSLLKVSERDLKAMEFLLNLFILMADPKSRAVEARQISWSLSLQHIKSERARKRILDYFGQ